MWERGLKPLQLRPPGVMGHVAPHVGAWIETRIFRVDSQGVLSLPMWERGLKLFNKALELCTLCRSPCGSVD